MKIEIELDDAVMKEILYRIDVISERAPWPEKEVMEFIAQDIASVYAVCYSEYLDSAIMEDDELVRKKLGLGKEWLSSK